jgi:hypothetical protein
MGDTPDTAQSLIRFLRNAANHDHPPDVTMDPKSVASLLDHIDTLTARAEKAETALDRLCANYATTSTGRAAIELAESEAERDALRALMRHVFVYVADDPWLTPNFREEIRRAAEGGQ